MSHLLHNAYHIFQRSNQFNSILWNGPFYKHYVVDQFEKVEAELLQYLRQNLVSLRAVDYISLWEQLKDAGNTKN